MSCKRWHRAWVLLLHLLVVGLAPLADATVSTTTSEARLVHVEAPGRGGCAPAHDHLRCQVCRVIAHETLAGSRCLRIGSGARELRAPLPGADLLLWRRALGARALPLL